MNKSKQIEEEIKLLEELSNSYKTILVLKDDKIQQRSVILLGEVTTRLNKRRATLRKLKHKHKK